MNRIEELKNILHSFKNGGKPKIHIKESQKGSFTRYCNGKVTSECIARGKRSPDPKIRRKATFAANARRGKHQEGGIISEPLVYEPFIPEDAKEKKKKEIMKNAQVPQVVVDQTRFPVEPVYIYKPIELNGEPKGTSIQDSIEETISGISNANNDNLNEINKQLKSAGYKKTQRAAILATIVAESGANPTAIGDSGKAKGLFQGHPNRFSAGIDLGSQIKLLLTELKDFNNQNAGTSSRRYNKRNAFDLFHNTEDLSEAVSALTANYIRPANTDNEIRKRYNIAQQLINQMA